MPKTEETWMDGITTEMMEQITFWLRDFRYCYLWCFWIG